MTRTKSPLQSKTLAANLVALGAFYAQSRYGYVAPPEVQAAALGVLNIALRFLTKAPLAIGKVMQKIHGAHG